MNKIEQQVMAAVLMIHAARALISAAAIKLYILAACIVALASLTSISQVLVNLGHIGPVGYATFFFVAFVKTGLLVRLAVIVGVATVLSLLVEIVGRIPKNRVLAV